MSNFFSRLSYSFGNEDWRTESAALRLQPDDEVLCITASGDRPLNLLYQPCKKIVSIDANPIQNHLLHLKAAAMKELSFSDYLGFLGASDFSGRTAILQKLSSSMDHDAAQFWRSRLKMIEKGVLYQGEVERLSKVVAKGASLLQRKKLKRLFEMDNLEEQQRFLKEEWNGKFWESLLRIVLNPLISWLFIEDPGLTNVASSIKPGKYIYHRMHESLHRDLAKKNLLLSMLLQGKVSPEAYPPYLLEDGTEAIRDRLHRLEIKTMDVIEYLESLEGPTFDAFSLSDIISYLKPPQHMRLYQAMIKTAKPGARFCLRQFLSAKELPEAVQPHFKRDKALESELEQKDNCFVYRFMVGHLS